MVATVATVPIVLVPLFGLCVSGASHVTALDRLLRTRSIPSASGAPAGVVETTR